MIHICCYLLIVCWQRKVISNRKLTSCLPLMGSGGGLYINMSSLQYREPHVLSLKWESPYLGMTVFILTPDEHTLQQTEYWPTNWLGYRGSSKTCNSIAHTMSDHSGNLTPLRSLIYTRLLHYVHLWIDFDCVIAHGSDVDSKLGKSSAAVETMAYIH